MDLEYDRKFEEMKKYIPFLESMIKRLENTNSVSNPRQAQLDKIRSLRDLLMDKKKRMKMENLLKCEQVLVNLYEKVEQRDSLPILKNDGNTSQKDKTDLNTVRNKLKSAVTKLQNESVETLPEIARASETEEVCVPGSKEPALFQRRPNKSSMSPTRPITNRIKEPSPPMSKRNYTRVLLSPETNQNRWSTEENMSEKPLFSRRSPKKSPRRRSPSYHKKERKKVSKSKSQLIESKDLNITLNVPEESLNSLNTKDILTRIINCSDNDVDIDTLRELRTQILGELKETGANEDISDLILKSYKKKAIKDKKAEEIEEGELSDSESEAIESIYGSLVIMEKEKSISVSNKISNEEPRKIQICLVINSDKNKSNSTNEGQDKKLPVDSSDFETLSNKSQSETKKDLKNVNTEESTSNMEQVKSLKGNDRTQAQTIVNENKAIEQDVREEQQKIVENDSKPEMKMAKSKEIETPKQICEAQVEQNEDINKYPESRSSSNIAQNNSSDRKIEDSYENEDKSNEINEQNSNVEIPLLEPTQKVSEIDILQALKKEILSETDNVLSSDTVTPALHQPKITKVGNAHEIGSKKRISIENYKAKTNTPLKNILGNEMSSSMNKDEINRKQSLKLTEKECERFNFPSKLTLDESSDDEDKSLLSASDIYENLAPKSPDHEDFADTGIKPPVIIPSDPVQTTIVNSEADIDMRKILPVLQCNLNSDVLNALSFCKDNTIKSFSTEMDKIKNNDKPLTPLLDPRMKKDINNTINPESPNPYIMNVDKTPRPVINFGTSNINALQNVNSNSSLIANSSGLNRTIISPNLPSNLTPNIPPNVAPNLGPIMTPIRTQNVPNMTPNTRSYDMTPSRQTVDNEDYSNQKHVYAPMFPIVDTRGHSEKPQWDNLDNNGIPIWEDPRNIPTQRDTDYREIPRQRDNEYNPAFEHYRDSPRNDRYNYEKLDQCHRTECPTTPSHPFGRLDGPNTSSSYVKMDASLTPVHPFGRSDCPSTPNHPFGRSDCPPTPSHPFGRSECPSTPSHPFGRPDPLIPMPFNRPDFNHITNQSFGKPIDPRFKRSSDYDMYHNRDDERDHGFFQDRNFNSSSYKPDHNNRNNNHEFFRKYQREQSIGRNDRHKNYDHNARNYKESRRETSVGRYNRDYDNDRSYTRNHGSSNRSYDYRQQNEFKNYDKNERRNYKREKSVSRSTSHSSSRDPSVGRSFPKENQVSVQRNTDHSFTIDTSVNRTFQENNNHNDRFSSFDARRQRAASVGRTLARGSSPNKVVNKVFNNFENKNKNLSFRRACSVGREMKDNKLDFKDIKADLKSFKLKGESRWSKVETSKEERKYTEVDRNCELRSKKEIHKSHVKTSQGNSKYSPRQNNRDPRMRRENSYEYKSSRDSSRSKSKDSKSFGIVYSNDNITKGTILGPGYGVKNYKIPKIKRPQETVVDKEINSSKSKECENAEIDNKSNDGKNNLSKNIINKNESTTTKNKICDTKYTTKENKAELINNQKKSKGSKCDIEVSSKVKVITENQKSKNAPKQKNSDDLSTDSCKNQEIEGQNISNHAANTSIDNVEKRITRSTSKSLSLDSSVEISPVKRTKRAKKAVVYDTDSDDNDKKVKNIVRDNLTSSNEEINNEKSYDIGQNKEVTSKKEDSDSQCALSTSSVKSKDKKVSSGIDSGFGMDDLEIFADNITSDPVIDNINALIADLDNDLDSSKPVDTNSNFNRELTLETMLENITSPEDNEKKQDTFNDIPDTKTDSMNLLKNKNDSKLICHEEKSESNSETNNPTMAMIESDDTNNKPDLNYQDNEIQNKIDSKHLENHQSLKQENNIATNKILDHTQKTIETEDNHNSDAIVSTSEEREKQKLEVQPVKSDISVQNKPDSTINSIVTQETQETLDSDQRNLPDSTNDINEEINSVISSTQNSSNNMNKLNADINSCTTSTPKNNLGKLLSLKIKELLGLLGCQSGDNEKIKKKLEKLSEIVSDDEENTVENEIDKQKSDTLNKNNNESDSVSPLIDQEKTEATENKDINNTESINQSAEDIKSVNDKEEGCISKENNFVSDKNETNKDDMTAAPTEINNESDNLNEQKEKNLIETEENINKINEQDVISSKKTPAITKKTKKGKKKTAGKVGVTNEEKRLTRSDAANLRFDKQPTVKKPSRELQKLQEDIREMFIRDDILGATGIRMCRLAKLVDESKNLKDDQNYEISNQEPVVLLEKCNDMNVSEDTTTTDKLAKKKIVKGKKTISDQNVSIDTDAKDKNVTNIKTKVKDKISDVDPYVFETDSVNETKNASDNKNDYDTSDSENESLYSSKSFGSTEVLAEVKKKVKRKRSKGWKAGIIKPKNKKKKIDRQQDSVCLIDNSVQVLNKTILSGTDCFTDKNYCFDKNVSNYECRLCTYNGADIVCHYKKQHPHSEIPLSRMSPSVALEAIKESEKLNFQVISKVPSKRYICRFCFKEFGGKKPVLESFFWHVVSMHTGEYKQLCSECLNVQRCPFSMDIPPPPKDIKGQLLGYVCEKCNYTQISLENLKTHVIIRHNDEQTAVYTINLSVTAKGIINNMLTEVEGTHNTDLENKLPRILRSSRSNRSIDQSIGESSDVRSDSTDDCNRSLKKQSTKSEIEKVVKTSNIQSKITFESDNTDEISNYDEHISKVKVEPSNENQEDVQFDNLENESDHVSFDLPVTAEEPVEPTVSNDICNYSHFKIKYSTSGSKEYICCINGNDLHYRTTLLISFKKHVQLKHSEHWDGYCFICKVIVTPQGVHLFKDCLQHYLDQHIDNFPVMEEVAEKTLPNTEPIDSNKSISENVSAKPYINVRPLSELISKSCTAQTSEESASPLPVIESVISLGTGIEQSRPSPSYPKPDDIEVPKQYRHEEAQAEIMSKKHRVVLEAMMSHVKLVKVFKCAGRFCSFTTDSAEDALLHASTHTRVGGEDSLKCAYCDFDSLNNAIDLITHVFKNHGCCQYACGMCFYRAAASQLVNAHIKRVHAEVTTAKILHTTIQTAPIKEDNILSREAAVPYYLCCASSGSDAPCKFRTYTPGKFCEHLQIRHSTATDHSCFMCSATLTTPADLIRHLKTHGLKLYQCTWCVFGADNEMELLAHASANHPDKQPKAYLRIITNKEGTSEFRVLPLAHLNKSEIPAIEIAPSTIKENPVREAERSIELEKLIGHTTFMIESMTSEVKTKTIEGEITNIGTTPDVNEPLLENMSLLQESQQRMVTPPPQIIGNQSALQDSQLTPILKTEVIEMTPEKIPSDPNVVYCLDSDEEDSSQNFIDLCKDQTKTQIDNPSTQPKTLPLTQLFLCAKCNITCRCGAGFKKHIMACYSQIPDPIPCAHCPLKVKKRHIVIHYTKIHAEVSRPLYLCSKCPKKFLTLAQVREHDRNDHLMSTSSNVSNADKAPAKTQVKPSTAGKRKRSLASKEKAIEPPEKIKRFGPNDVNLLPINPILDDSVFCSLCEFSTKVRLNMVRHLQLHAEQQIVSQTAPVNPVPHLETNEKHFDRMLNLASSSIISRTPDKSKIDSNATITLMIPPEAVSRYPKYVPERHRHTCGAKGCSYISVDESMFKCHWETLHSGTSDYRCVHCPPHQHLDTSKPLSAVRIIAHLKMHDATLYACSVCSYYHYKRQILENHLNDIHKGIGQVMVVREEGVSIPVNTSQAQVSAPTMDLKPWQCGLCKFKSLLCPEVVEHCAKIHNSKMQYKCAYCAFKTSNSENITKHQSKSHSDKPEEIFYYYYREGSVPTDPDGTPLWQKQCQRYDVSKSAVKSEVATDVCTTPQISVPISKPPTMEIDLNLVKTEVIEPVEDTIEQLCKDFGEFCEPNGLKYKCSLCKNVVEDSVDAMQSHLFEELKYRKWGCSICSYKAFHKAGLNGHMQTEHRQNKEPIALQVDKRVETWVAKLLEYQTEMIEKNKENLAKQKEEILRAAPGPSRPKTPPKRTVEVNEIKQTSSNTVANKPTMVELERLFGSLGASVNMSFCCPKCHSMFKDEDAMKNHLESELNKIRWFCSNCSVTFQTYHEAQFHCRSVHQGQSARPVEVVRDASIRSAWIEAVIRVQKLTMNYVPLPSKSFVKDTEQSEEKSDVPENSLLVVRYEERIPTPEEQMVRRSTALNTDSDDDKLIIDEPIESKKAKALNCCPHCEYQTINSKVSRAHILRHYNLRPFTCSYCGQDGSKKAIEQHQKNVHLNQPIKLIYTPIPTESPLDFFQMQSANLNDQTKLVCLVCRNAFTEAETALHVHDNIKTSFGKKGDVVVKCSVCSTLHKDITAYFNHHKSLHGSISVNYVFEKLTISKDTKLKYNASRNKKLANLMDTKTSDLNDSSNSINTAEPIPTEVVIDLDDDDEVGTKRRNLEVSNLSTSRKVARKSTTKLPFKRSFARKSTTKLPFNVTSEPEEFSYYGTRPSTENLDGVTTMMSFCNIMMPFTLKKLSAIININPVVEVEMLKK
ncbi:uncharacterized protein LOC124532741 [Vanessa cardui]|uniref:uncharacterized protein LOC124532741 n=1 Tax=Vanessa cardui TaxID=171605 RepID=UPI001F12B180|nr:uncharacterized protein LOC124532741 [Vanessa cardui]XP_046963749.1 uncharacterized protein LOC124532741 [Vanessa cardui]XP_046963750.1 uncharacterized protein LOC124532741 [Vanessa cardui]XP_046963752.1 uncharacterized protein LOC124532741 [Vanessa cardui]